MCQPCATSLHVRLSIEKQSRTYTYMQCSMLGFLISISNHNIHCDVDVASFSMGSGNGWIVTTPLALGVMEYKQEDRRRVEEAQRHQSQALESLWKNNTLVYFVYIVVYSYTIYYKYHMRRYCSSHPSIQQSSDEEKKETGWKNKEITRCGLKVKPTPISSMSSIYIQRFVM